VGQGYWNRPEQSADTFRATLAGTDGPHFLRTGDLGYLRDGELHVAGRQKDLVIVRGRNHHPQDVERTAEGAHPVVRPGATAAFAVPVDGVEELVVVAEVGPRDAGGDLDAVVRAVRGAVAEEHDVRPHRVVVIRAGTLPKTSSGKVQRHACRDAWLSGGLDVLTDGTDAQPAAPRPAAAPGSTARILLAADVLRAELAGLLALSADRVDLDVPLARLGLDSMTAVALQHRVVQRLGVDLPLDDVVVRTGTELVELLAAAAGSGPAQPGPSAEGDHELPANQAALWLQHQLVPDSPAHLLAMAVRLDAAVDVAALRAAVRTLADRHDALRTTFPLVDGLPVARVHAELAPRLDVVDAPDLDEPALDAAVARAAHEPFDTATGPLLRVILLRCGSAGDRLVLAVDHLVADLWSLQVVLDELGRLYAGERPEAAGSYQQHARGQRAVLGDREEELARWWQHELHGAPALLRLGPAADGPPIRRMRAEAVAVGIGPDLSAAVTALAARLGTTTHAVLLAAYQALLGQWTGQQDLVVGSPAHGRGSAAHSRTVGLFVGMMALRGRPAPETTVAALVRAAHDGVRAGLAHSALPFARLVEHLRPARHPARPPLVQAVLNWQQAVGEHSGAVAALALDQVGAPVRVAGLPATTLPLPPAGTQFELVLTVAETADGLAARLQFDPDLVAATDARAAAGHLGTLLAAFAADPDRVLGALPRLPRAAVAAAGSVWDGGPAPRVTRRVDELLADRAAARPAATALVCGDVRIGYRELDRRVGALAARLRAAGAGRGDLVALHLERSVEFVVAAAAVLRAGAAYLPLDLGHPEQRRRYVLDDAAPRFALVHGRDLGHDGPTVLDMADEAVDATAAETGPGAHEDDPGGLDDLAYVIYTSGSTGRPKGVPVTHRGLSMLLAGTGDLGFTERDVWMLFHSCAFDFSVWELWGCLVHGSTAVVVPPEATVSADAFWDLVHRHRVTVLNQTPAVFREMTAAAPGRLAGLAVRQVILGGEKLEPAHLAAWRAHGPPSAALTNMYGLTETTVVATRGAVAQRADGVVPIGAPLAGTTLCLLDPAGEPVAPGEVGEIGLSGPHLTPGYLRRPGLTAERFTPHPRRPGERLYRTGDLARRCADGALEYLGRVDEQVQIRGYRVEPGEITAALVNHPAVRDAVVLADTAPTGHDRLVAYLVPAGPDAPSRAELRGHLRGRLPEYMVPGRFVTVPAIPLTGSGKVDRRALPSAGREVGRAGPATPTEARLVALAGEIVEHDRIGHDDDLFDLGWHSLLMARLATRIREEFAVEVALQDLFAEPTVEGISALVDAAAPVAPAAAIPRVDRSRYRVEAGAGLPEAMRG
jgi:amino acid adenylation domain-containing protein